MAWGKWATQGITAKDSRGNFGSKEIYQLGGTATSGNKPFMVLEYKVNFNDAAKSFYESRKTEHKYPFLNYLAELVNNGVRVAGDKYYGSDNINEDYYVHNYTYYPMFVYTYSDKITSQIKFCNINLNNNSLIKNSIAKYENNELSTSSIGYGYGYYETISLYMFNHIYQHIPDNKNKNAPYSDRKMLTRNCYEENQCNNFDQLVGGDGEESIWASYFYIPDPNFGTNPTLATAQKKYAQGGKGGKILIDKSVGNSNTTWYDVYATNSYKDWLAV